MSDTISSSPLLSIIQDKIKKDGPLSIATFMETVLLHPEHGYYMTRDPFGAKGDFTTAPEISQVFGEIIGLWCTETWKSLGSPAPFVLCEVGPGRGTLMQDALRAAQNVAGFVEAMQLYLLEASPVLRQVQQGNLADYKPTHINAMTEVPELPIITIANEFFDALPIRQFVRVGEEWQERHVTLNEHGQLAYILPPSTETPHFDLSEGTVVEVSPFAGEWASMIARPIVKSTGAALIIDYGDDEVIGETLQALSHHQAAHPLSNVGDADITAHVTFDPIADAARKIGCRVRGPVPQGEWLLSLGAKERTAQLCEYATEEQERDLVTALARLTDPAAMGYVFKVMSFTNRNAAPLAGFE